MSRGPGTSPSDRAPTDRPHRGTDETTDVVGRAPDERGPTAALGVHRAPDGSDGGPLRVDCAGPHAALVVGKRGSGKSYTLGVLAEELARTDGIAPAVVDPMGTFAGLDREAAGAPVPAVVERSPTVSPTAIAPADWPPLLGLDPESAAGSLVWRGASAADGLDGMLAFVADADVPRATRRAARNHLELAAGWGAFDAGDPVASLDDGAATVLDVSGLDRRPVGALVRAVADRCYRGRVEGRFDRQPWLLVDEAHALFGGVAEPALRRLLTRGRQPGVSLVLATQRPGALPEVVASQADLVLAHRVTGRPDREALSRARPTYAPGDDRRPTAPGEAVVVDDATETARPVRIRERDTPHGGAAPRIGSREGND